MATTPIKITLDVSLDPVFAQMGHSDTRFVLSMDPLFEMVFFDETASISTVPGVSKERLEVTVGGQGPIYARYLLTTDEGFTGWSEIKACAFTTINPPKITLDVNENPSSTSLTPTFYTSTYDPVSAAGGHVDTDWIITTRDHSPVYEFASTRDVNNLYSYTVPAGELKPNTEYILMVAHNGQYKNGTYGFFYFSTGA